MSQMLCCSNGHHWEPFPGTGSGAGATLLVCPVCGSREHSLLSPPTLVLRDGGPGHAPTSWSGPGSGSGLPLIEGYEIQEELGRGGMGIVYKAWHGPSERTVALKVIRMERQANPEVIRRFRREAQAAARLAHPNVVAVYAFDQDGETHFLAMEYVPGITLQHLVERSGPLAVGLACDVIRQTALGLQHAGDQGLVHRDIKPSNLMIVLGPGGKVPARPLVKLVDMGVARLYQLRDLNEESLTTLTRDGTVIGTPDYIAPEQLEDPHGADIRADLYSLGCTLYFLLSGQVPFPGGTLIQKLDRQRWQTPPSVDQLQGQISSTVAALVRRLMAKNPDHRYQTPAELLAALEQLTRTGELPTGHQVAQLQPLRCDLGKQGPIRGLACSPAVNRYFSAGTDRTIRVWDLATGKQLHNWGPVSNDIACVVADSTGEQVLTAQGVGIRVWEAGSGREVRRLLGHSDAVRDLALSTDGKLVLSGGDDRIARLWDITNGRELERLTGHKGRLTSVALSPDNRLAATADRDQTIRIWDLGSGRELRTCTGPRGAVLSLTFTPDGRFLLSGHFDTTLRLWEVSTGRELRRFNGHKQMVAIVAVTPNGQLLSAGADKAIRYWDAESGAELGLGLGHTGPITCLAVLPDGKALSGSQDETIRLWQLPDE
jgi:eukaryotic-like serine/threonine-protein kinase